MKDVKEFSAQEIAPMIDAYLGALEVGSGRDRLDVCDHIHRRVGESYKWHRKEIKTLADEAFERNGWRRDHEGWWWKVAHPVKAPVPVGGAA